MDFVFSNHWLDVTELRVGGDGGFAVDEGLARNLDLEAARSRDVRLCHIIEFKSVYRASFKRVTFISFQRDMLRPQTPYVVLPTHS